VIFDLHSTLTAVFTVFNKEVYLQLKNCWLDFDAGLRVNVS